MIRQHTALPHRQPKLSTAAATSGHSFAEANASPSFSKSILRKKNHSPAAIARITTIRTTSVRRRLKAAPAPTMSGTCEARQDVARPGSERGSVRVLHGAATFLHERARSRSLAFAHAPARL